MDLTNWQKAFAQIMQDTYEGKIKPGELNEADVLDTYNKITEGAAQGYGNGWNVAEPDKKYNYSNIDSKVLQMKRNIYKFSAAKDVTMLQALNAAMYKNGKLLPFDEFKAEALKLGAEFKEHWLQAEYQTARQSGIMAQKWNDIQANTDLFPNLKYQTQHDDRVRPEHAALDGIIAPIGSDFWKKYYPPNGWRCRCDAIQTAEPVTQTIPTNFSDIKPEFEVNVGVSGQIFNEDSKTGHRFFALAKDSPEWEKRFELSKLEGGFDNIKTPKGNSIKASIYADNADFSKNLKAAATIIDNTGTELAIRPHLYLDEWKNPEFIDVKANILGDRISPDWTNVKTATNNAFQKKLSKKHNGQLSDQNNCFLAIEMGFEPTHANLNVFVRQSWAKFTHYSQLDYIILYKEGYTAIKVERDVIKKGFEVFAYTIEQFFK